MKNISVLLARAVWFTDLQLINPSGLALGPIQATLRDRYKFLVYPTSPQELDITKGIKYADGEFGFEGKTIGVTVRMYNNGVAADTIVSTEASEAFLNDLTTRVTTIGLRFPKDSITKIVYESQVEVF